MLALINRILDWIKSLFWKEEMELTLVGLQYSGKTTFVNVIAVSYQKTIICVVECASLFWVTQCLVCYEAFQSDEFDMKLDSRDGVNPNKVHGFVHTKWHTIGWRFFVLLLLTYLAHLYEDKPFVFLMFYSYYIADQIATGFTFDFTLIGVLRPDSNLECYFFLLLIYVDGVLIYWILSRQYFLNLSKNIFCIMICLISLQIKYFIAPIKYNISCINHHTLNHFHYNTWSTLATLSPSSINYNTFIIQ